MKPQSFGQLISNGVWQICLHLFSIELVSLGVWQKSKLGVGHIPMFKVHPLLGTFYEATKFWSIDFKWGLANMLAFIFNRIGVTGCLAKIQIGSRAHSNVQSTSLIGHIL